MLKNLRISALTEISVGDNLQEAEALITGCYK